MPNKLITPEIAEKLRKAVARAKQTPVGFNMRAWAKPSAITPCGVVGCLAFEILVANTDRTPKHILAQKYVHTGVDAASVLGLEYRMIEDLFHLSRWPLDLITLYYIDPINALEQAVEKFIAADGQDGWNWEEQDEYQAI